MREVYELYYEELVYFGLKLVRDRQVVEDIVIDSFLALFESDSNPVGAKQRLYTAVKHKCLNHLRSLQQRGAIISRLFTEENIELEIIETRLLVILNKAIDDLPIESKQVIQMYYMDEMTCVDIAGILNKPTATIRSIKRFALDKLFNLMKLKREI